MNTKFYSVVLAFLLCIVSKNTVSAQENITQRYIDTLKIEPIDSANVSLFKNYLLKNSKLRGWTKYYAHKGFLFLKKGQKDSAYFYSKKAIKTFEEMEPDNSYAERNLTRANYTAGLISRNRKQFYDALQYFHECIRIIKKYPDANFRFIEFALDQISIVHLKLGNYSLALKYKKKIIAEHYDELTVQYKGSNLTQTAVLYEYLHKNDSAKIYYEKALQLNHPYFELTTNSNLGNLYYHENKIDSAVYFFSAAKKIADTIKLPSWRERSRIFAKTNYHFVNIHNGKTSPYIVNDLLQKIDSLKSIENPDTEDRDMMLSTMDYLALAYEKTQRVKLANEVYKDRAKFVQDFSNMKLDEELQKLELRLETKSKEEEISSLEAIKDLQDRRIQQQNAIIYVLIGIALLITVLILLWLNRRNIKNKYEKVVLQQQLLRSQMNPHFLFNTLNTILHATDTKPEKTKQYVLKLSKLLRTTLENSREEFVPLQDEIEAIDNYLNLQSNFSEMFDFIISIADDLETEFTYVPPMLIQPFVENAIIHGITNANIRGLVSLDFTLKGDLVSCTITDNGIGYSKSSQKEKNNLKGHTSISGDIVKERLVIYNKQNSTKASLNIDDILDENEKASGTKVILNLPSYEI
ncbi:MAG: histidine kinase [Bacteroidota bacterium]